MPNQNEDAIDTMLEVEDKNDHVQLDAVLSKLVKGWYQVVTVVLLVLVYVSNSLFKLNYVFAVEDVNYRVPQCDGTNPAFHAAWLNGSLDLDTNVKQCHKEGIKDSCTLQYNTSLIGSDERIYENPHTFIAEVQRRIADVFAGSVGPVLGTAKSYSSSFWVYVVLEWLEAAISDVFSPIFMLTMEDQHQYAASMLGDVQSDPVQLDSVLSSLGTGRHHVATMAMLALVYATNSMYNVNYVFAVEDVNYRCKVPQCDGTNPSFHPSWLNISTEKTTVKQCRRLVMVDDSCSELYNSTLIDCDEWVYENPNSFVAEFNLACEDWKRMLVGTIHSLGNMMGLVIQGQISDRFGRKIAAVFAGTVGAVLGIAKSFSSWFWMYLVLEGLEGTIGDVFSPVFLLSIEMVEKKRALLYQLILMNCYTVGLVVMPFIAWTVPYWRNFLRVIYAPSLIILTYTCFLDESIRWLLSKGKRQRALQLISKIARRNNVELDVRLLSRLQHVEKETQTLTYWRQLVKTFRSRIIMQRFLVCLVWWFTVTLVNYGMMISSVFFEGNKYLNFSLLLIMDFPANIICWFVLAKCKRKTPLLVSFLVGGIFCICQPVMPEGYAWAGLTLLMMFEMLATFSYNVVYISTSELFPTYTRNSMHAICVAVGRIGSLAAPQMPLLMSLWSGLPTLFFGLLSMVAGVLTLLMPDTADTELPNTIAEAERIGNMPVLKNDSKLHRR